MNAKVREMIAEAIKSDGVEEILEQAENLKNIMHRSDYTMKKWISELNELGIFDWFSLIEDNEKAAVIINLLGEQLLGSPRDHQPSHIIESLPYSFEYSEDDWHTLITQCLIDEDGKYEYAHEYYEDIRDHEPCMTEKELISEINFWYIEWCCDCRKAFMGAIS